MMHSFKKMSRGAALVVGLAAMFACDDDDEGNGPTNPDPSNEPIAIVSGDAQTGTAGAVLPQPLVVEVRDPNGDPIDGVLVTWEVTGGGGSLAATTTFTDADGRTSATLSLGPTAGPNTVTASLDPTGSVTFTATATTGSPARVPGY